MLEQLTGRNDGPDDRAAAVDPGRRSCRICRLCREAGRDRRAAAGTRPRSRRRAHSLCRQGRRSSVVHDPWSRRPAGKLYLFARRPSCRGISRRRGRPSGLGLFDSLGRRARGPTRPGENPGEGHPRVESGAPRDCRPFAGRGRRAGARARSFRLRRRARFDRAAHSSDADAAPGEPSTQQEEGALLDGAAPGSLATGPRRR